MERERVDYAFYNLENKVVAKGAVYTPYGMGSFTFGPEQAESLARVQERNYVDRIHIQRFSYIGYPDNNVRKAHENMSTALWCDKGNHAFSINDKQRQKMVLTEVNQDTGEEIEIRGDVCGTCRISPFTQPRANQAKIAALEAENGIAPSVDVPPNAPYANPLF